MDVVVEELFGRGEPAGRRLERVPCVTAKVDAVRYTFGFAVPDGGLDQLASCHPNRSFPLHGKVLPVRPLD